MAVKPRDVTDAELAVLQVLWDHGASTIREVADVVYPDNSARQYSTVKRLLARLQSKGYVKRDEGESLIRFVATLQRNDLVGRRLEALAESLCEGSISPLLLQLAQRENLTKRQRQTLLDLINELEGKSKRKKGKSAK